MSGEEWGMQVSGKPRADRVSKQLWRFAEEARGSGDKEAAADLRGACAR
jgi:hypothetical protein